MKKNILVAGGSGFVGINLIKMLSKFKKYKITATFFKSKRFYKVKNVKYIKANLENPKDCSDICKRVTLYLSFLHFGSDYLNFLNPFYSSNLK